MPMPNLSLEKAIEISGRHYNIQIGEIINRKKKKRKRKSNDIILKNLINCNCHIKMKELNRKNIIVYYLNCLSVFMSNFDTCIEIRAYAKLNNTKNLNTMKTSEKY